MIFFLMAIILIAAFIYYYLTRTFDYWKNRQITGPTPIPFFGNIQDIALFRATQAECLQKIYKNYEGEKYVGMFQLSTPTLLLLEPPIIKQILVKDFQHFTDRGHHYDGEREPLTANLVNLEGVKWRILRHKLTPTFSSGKIKNMMYLLHDCGKQLLQYLQETMESTNEIEIEMRDFTAKFTTDVIGSCAFGLNFNSMSPESSAFRQMGREVLQPSKIFAFSKLLRVFFPALFRTLKLRTFPKKVNDFFLNMVTETLKHRQKHNIRREDFLNMLTDLRESKDEMNPESDQDFEVEFTDNLIAAQAFVFFLAGFETSSTTLSFCLHELAINKEIQNDVFEEIKRTVEKYGPTLSYESLKDLILLEQCLLETMRKYPPVQALARICTKSYQLPETSTTIDKGTAVLIPVYALHHDEKYFANPEKFEPQRFSKKNINQRPFGVYLPFGDGPRICIGKRFALLEMKLALATFLFKYEIDVCSKTRHPLVLDPRAFILAPKDGIWLKINRRK
uniref:Cytochrome P450 6DD3 n=1 Tax=Maconellicoccus hirsutus TaxID=177089 RepID=A0AAT9UTS1_MACHI